MLPMYLEEIEALIKGLLTVKHCLRILRKVHKFLPFLLRRDLRHFDKNSFEVPGDPVRIYQHYESRHPLRLLTS
jgi:hypothetical protein